MLILCITDHCTDFGHDPRLSSLILFNQNFRKSYKLDELGPNTLITHLVMSASNASCRSINFNPPTFFGAHTLDHLTQEHV